MSQLSWARQSPRIENGILYFYEGDTFDLDLTLELTDQDGENITVAASSTVKVKFVNRQEVTVKELTFTNIEGNTVTLDFDSTCTALFPKGEYKYRVFYTAGERTTLCADNGCVVE